MHIPVKIYTQVHIYSTYSMTVKPQKHGQGKFQLKFQKTQRWAKQRPVYDLVEHLCWSSLQK